jgi:hypothetical protein
MPLPPTWLMSLTWLTLMPLPLTWLTLLAWLTTLPWPLTLPAPPDEVTPGLPLAPSGLAPPASEVVLAVTDDWTLATASSAVLTDDSTLATASPAVLTDDSTLATASPAVLPDDSTLAVPCPSASPWLLSPSAVEPTAPVEVPPVPPTCSWLAEPLLAQALAAGASTNAATRTDAAADWISFP